MKTKVISFLALIIYFSFFSCTAGQDRLEKALVFAGANRAELEKVLLHYSRNQQDSLKYKAACFLIENMPYHYSYNSPTIDSIKSLVHLVVTKKMKESDAKAIIQKKFSGELNQDTNKVYDSHVIKASYLIRNIDQAFYVREKQPWGRYISFEDFCEYILPYRCTHEPIEEWREKYYNKYQGLLDSLSVVNTDILEVYRLLNDSSMTKEGWKFTQWLAETGLSDLGAIYSLNNRIGSCWDRTFFVTYILRSIGIPCGIDYLKQEPRRVGTHCWNFLVDTTGLSCDFEGGSWTHPIRDKFVTSYRVKGKIYRKTFSKQSHRLQEINKSGAIPETFKDELEKDVSCEYFPFGEIAVKCEQIPKNTNIAYLCLFNNKEWIPVDWAEIKNDSAKFYHMDWKNIVYLVGYFENGEIIPAANPILTVQDGKYAIPLNPDTSRLQKIHIDRKYPDSKTTLSLRSKLVGARFQSANYANFKDAVDLYQIKSRPFGSYQTINISANTKYRYVRLIAIDGKRLDVSELEFYDSNSAVALNGIPMGNLPANGDERYVMRKAFDGDPLTAYVSSLKKKAWVGMDFREKKEIVKIRFAPRGDDNSVREGDEYELKYSSKNGWISLGKQLATTSTLTYTGVPNKALLWLSNLTRGKEERIFTYENGKQKWW